MIKLIKWSWNSYELYVGKYVFDFFVNDGKPIFRFRKHRGNGIYL